MARSGVDTGRFTSARARTWLAAVLLLGLAVRSGIVFWDRPWEPHHPDEHILPLEAIALWEGITPREVGWPATTTRLLLSVAAAGRWAGEQGAEAWQARDRPDRVLTGLTGWIGARYIDQSALLRLGRMLSIATGALQLAAVAWVLCARLGPAGTLAGTLAVALSPMAVLHSQYVLADITGVLFATLAIGAAYRPTTANVALASACTALAAASKFHFGIWLLTPLLTVWMAPQLTAGRRWTLTGLVAGVFFWVFLASFPWAGTNPPLALKEFLGVVAVKIGAAPAADSHFLGHLALLFGSLGALLWGGGLLCLALFRREDWRTLLPVAVPALLAAVILAGSAIVFDRYSLVILPGLALIAGLGWDRALSSRGRVAGIVLIAATGLTVGSLARAERIAAEADVDVLVREWILSHVPRGRRVAIHDEANALLPRAAEQLRACVESAATERIYDDKWRTLGFEAPPAGIEPLRSMLLNDELAYAYWCRRELQARADPGYMVVRYHNAPRSNAVLEQEAVASFLSTADTEGIDVLVMNRPLDGADPPAQRFVTRRGERYVYVRSSF